MSSVSASGEKSHTGSVLCLRGRTRGAPTQATGASISSQVLIFFSCSSVLTVEVPLGQI